VQGKLCFRLTSPYHGCPLFPPSVPLFLTKMRLSPFPQEVRNIVKGSHENASVPFSPFSSFSLGWKPVRFLRRAPFFPYLICRHEDTEQQ
jgi:hypothetical protein